MSNLSDLLPAGAAAKQLTFTDSGSGISSKAPVVLNSDGTVSEVSGSSSTVGAQAEFSSSTPDYIDTAASSDYLVVIYKRSSGIRIRAGEVSGSTITWGAETDVFYSATHWSGYPAICYDSTNDKFIISWTERDTYFTNFRCQPLSVASSGLGAVVTLGTASQVHTTAGAGSYAYNSMAYCPDTDHFIMVNSVSLGNWYGTAFVGQLGSGGTTVDVNTTGYTFKSVNSTDYISVGYDENADRFVISYHASSTSSVVTALAAGSGASSSLTFGTETNLPANAYNVFPIYDSSISKTVLVYKTQSNSNGEAKVATVGSTTITLASTAYIWQSNSDAPTHEMIAATYDSNLNQVIISWRQTASPYASFFLGASVSGEVITYSTATTAFGSPSNTQYKSLSFLSGANLSLLAVADVGYGYGYSKMIAPASTNLTAQAFVGVADSAISASAAGSVIVQGGTVSGVALGTGPSAGADAIYAPTPDDPYRYSMCYDTANDKVIIAYNDEANNYYLYACVGTVTGNAISWGTVVAVDETGTMDQIQLTYDTNADRVLLVFRDQSTGGDLAGRVGTVSGTTISFGAKTTGTPHPAGLTSVYDPTAQKHLLTYGDNNTSNYGFSCVATVTGGATNTVAFGTQVQFSSDSNLSRDNFPMCYYTSENKIVMKYEITLSGGGRYAVACTISGTSVSFGTAVLEYAWGTYGQMGSMDITYDSTANKAVSVDAKQSSPYALYAAVISLSGTTITWGTPVTVNANSGSDNFDHAASIAYSSAGNNFLVTFSDDSNSSYLYAVSGTLSGTSTTWGTPVVVRSVSVASEQDQELIYDPDSQNFVVAYRTATPAGESNVISIGDLPLTVGTKYYVTTSGGFSSSADSPSVNAGIAISTTSLLLNGDS